jgi:hypothetical protein
MVLALTCSAPTDPELPEYAPITDGVVVAIDVTELGNPFPNLHVKQDSSDACGFVLSLERSPDVFARQATGSLVRANTGDIRVGRAIQAWIPRQEGYVDSCPRYAAPTVIVLD